MSIGADLFSKTFDISVTYIGYASNAMIKASVSWERAFVTLYVVIVGYQTMQGKFGEKSKEWLASILYLMVFQLTVAETAGYNAWIVKPVIGTVYDVVSWFATMANIGGAQNTAGVVGVFHALDTALEHVFYAIDHMEPSGSFALNVWLYVKVGSVSITLGILYAMVYFTFFGLMLIGFLMQVMLFVLGPFFLFFSCWKETRFLAFAWIKTLANYSLLPIIGSMAISITIFMINSISSEITHIDVADGVFTKEIGAAMLVAAASLYLLLKSPDIAAALTGGNAGNTSILAGALGMAGASAMNSGKAVWGSGLAQAGRQYLGDKAKGGLGAAWSYGLDTLQRASKAYSSRKGVTR